ncbi:glutaminyl-tRNA synthetase [Talaromyces stipitatus ATCC 10500]|uniref:glutamine--tRNA ligase n=1 Tax=Talaromyces stipitatus (strain ATCC 10500 / CBS 375.48 / QM 6759 / NRRL 1006) TaxID=441959 RepID=B8MP16_TALSN|nr:glutaminyl-tRNA synthetase [Talaromyces stipitatus ATCC 10500]EED14255.1 glutaminyl-tRNA synthetase [Talaromyces stipitatus ATCC 10500]
MADAITEATAKLQLDEETGEMVSKNELKKRLAKRAKKAKTAANKAAAPPKDTTEKESNAAKKPKPEETQLDPDAMFKEGFLAKVYDERPTGKDTVTRFPPEPNGFLHLGHAKAIAINFGFARYHGGVTNLRFDDTNPEAEEEIYFTSIIDVVEWLGFKPHAITYSSDNFQRLYDLAEKLIQLEKAYVCHCNEAEIKLQRGGEKGTSPRYRCVHAEQDVETNLQKFRDMRDGKYQPQAAFLRMKQDITSGNPQNWDLAAYRVLSKPHHRTGDKWIIYPTYDFTHCIVDSFEGITHSLCTTEFQQARESYEWLNKTLSLYEPMQREYGRLNVTGTIMSKRGLKKLIDGKYVRGWDDPRLYTLIALRRRGVPPGAILSFINELGVTTANSLIQLKRFEQSVRRYLETAVPRLMMVLDPLPVVIEDADSLASSERDLNIPFSPKNPEFGSHPLRLTNTVYIDRSDYREVDSKDYFRLAPGKTVGFLQMPYPVTATSFSKDADGKITEVRAVFNKDGKRPKTYIQWVPEGSRKVEVRVHTALFKSEDPASVEGGFLNDISPNSETVYTDALIEPGFEEVRRRAPWPDTEGEKKKAGPESVRFQGLRIAYFAMDSDSTDDKVVLNRIVSLKEDAGKS